MDKLKTDLYALSKYPEWYALKFELEKCIKELDDLSEIDLKTPSRVPLELEVMARDLAKQKIRKFIQRMNLSEKDPIASKKDPYQ